MKSNQLKFLVALLATSFLQSQASAQITPVGIASGDTTGTNYAMVENIKATCSTSASPINNIQSTGSTDNIGKLIGDRNTQYAVINVDSAVYQAGNDPATMKKVVQVFPFFSTEIHLVVPANSPIRSINDLVGKKVIEGPDGSGTWVSVQVIKATTGLQWTGYKMSQAEGLRAIQTGMADAEFINAGKPIKVLESAQGVRLVPISHPALDSFKYYNKVLIPTGTYAWQKTAVQTYKVDSMLATFNYRNQYQKEIAALVTCITNHIGDLQRSGHPKWKDVDPLDIDRVQWPAHPAAEKAIKAALKQ